MVDLIKNLLGKEEQNLKKPVDLYIQGKYNESINILLELEKSTKSKEELSEIHALIGKNYYSLANYKQSYFYLMKSFEENLNNPEANFGLGLLSQKDENYPIAINYFRKALELKPNTIDYLFRLAFSLSSISKNDEALEVYKKYEVIEPKHVSVLHNIAIIYCEKGMHDIEHEYYKRALEIDSKYDYPYVSGAICFRNRKMLKEALDLVNKGLEMRPNDLRITEQRGYVYFDMGESDNAKKDLEYVILYQPNNNYVKATLDKLTAKTTKTNPELTDFTPQNSNLNFDGVAGMVEFKKWVSTNIISPLKNAKLAEKYKKRFGGGLVFYGPPGCGKTYLANALAGESKLKIIKVKISEILNMWMGNSERNIRNLFETARKNAPCIIFLDEIEGLGGKRSDSSGGSKWLNILVNQLLMEMNEIDHNSEKVLVIGATNMPWLMDDALKRSGRFGRVVYIGAPDLDARKELFKFYLKDLPTEKKIDLDKLASFTENFAASDIMAICENASSSAFEKAVDSGKEHKIDQSMLMDAIRNERSDITEWFNMVARVLSGEELQELYPDLFNDLNKIKGLKSLSQRDKKMYG